MRHRALGRLLAGEQNPGLPTGVFYEVVGEASSGKTSLWFALVDAVVNQPAGKVHRVLDEDGVHIVEPPRRCLVLDYEHALDLSYLQAAAPAAVIAQTDAKGKLLNAKAANVYVHQPDTLEEGGDIALHLIASGEFGLVVHDSIAAMLAKAEKEKGMGEATIGLQARGLGMLYRKSAHMVQRYGVAVVMINQWRAKIGAYGPNPRTTPGGRAPEYWDSIKLSLSGRHETPFFADGKLCKIKTMKNKITGARDAEVTYHLGRGVGLSAEAELTERALAAGLVSWRGGRTPVKLLLGRQKTFPTPEAFFAALRAHPDVADRLWTRCEKVAPSGARRGRTGFDDDGE
jgi:RecA/RadA recombinase